MFAQLTGNMMFSKIDHRLGSELGLPEPYANKRALEIVNDAHDLVGAFASRLIAFKYGADGKARQNVLAFEAAKAKQIEFSRRLELLGGNAVEAARLIDDLHHFSHVSIDPWLP